MIYIWIAITFFELTFKKTILSFLILFLSFLQPPFSFASYLRSLFSERFFSPPALRLVISNYVFINILLPPTITLVPPQFIFFFSPWSLSSSSPAFRFFLSKEKEAQKGILIHFILSIGLLCVRVCAFFFHFFKFRHHISIIVVIIQHHRIKKK